jgi:AcrR family transcriptional regulator
MSQIETLEEEMDPQRNARIEKILSSAYELFSKRGIEDVAMTDIADRSKIGVASLYRYFETKEILVVRTATQVWETQMENVLPSLLRPKYKNSNGYDQLQEIFALFIKLYEKETDFLRFIYLFDAFAVKEKIPKEAMANYEAKILLVKQIISDAIQKGFDDGSIGEKYKPYGEMLYFTLMHTFFSVAQKLSLSGKMLDMDTKKNGSIQLKLLADVLLGGLK